MPRKQAWNVGDVFIVPLKDGTVSVAQIIGREPDALNSVTCTFSARRAKAACEVTADGLSSDDIIAILFCTRDLVDSGIWEVVGKGPVRVERRLFPFEPPALPEVGWGHGDWIGHREAIDERILRPRALG